MKGTSRKTLKIQSRGESRPCNEWSIHMTRIQRNSGLDVPCRWSSL